MRRWNDSLKQRDQFRVGVQHRHQLVQAGDAGVAEAPHDLFRFMT